MVQTRGFEEDDDCEIIPLRSAPTYKTYNDEDEDLPSYNEAIKEHGTADAHQITHVVTEILTSPRAQTTRASTTLPGEATLAKRRQTTYCLLILVSVPGAALLNGGICWYIFLLVSC